MNFLRCQDSSSINRFVRTLASSLTHRKCRRHVSSVLIHKTNLLADKFISLITFSYLYFWTLPTMAFRDLIILIEVVYQHMYNHCHDDSGFDAIIQLGPQEVHLVLIASSRELKKLYLYLLFFVLFDMYAGCNQL